MTLVEALVEGIVVGFYWGVVNDTIIEVLSVVVIMILLAVAVFTDPAGLAASQVWTLWEWLLFFVGGTFGRFIATDLKDKWRRF